MTKHIFISKEGNDNSISVFNIEPVVIVIADRKDLSTSLMKHIFQEFISFLVRINAMLGKHRVRLLADFCYTIRIKTGGTKLFSLAGKMAIWINRKPIT